MPRSYSAKRCFLERLGLITDNVKQAAGISADLEKRSDLDRMVDKIKTVL